MRSSQDIAALLAELNHCIADELEDQDLGFKQCKRQSRDKAIKTVVRMAVRMANGGGGTMVLGVTDRVEGREEAVLGVPPEVDTATAAALCQRSEPETRELLPGMEQQGFIEHGGTGRGTYWSIRPMLYARLEPGGNVGKRRRIDWDAAKSRVLSILMERAKRGEPGMTNKEIRQVTHFSRNQTYRLLVELRQENPQISEPGRGRFARYEYHE